MYGARVEKPRRTPRAIRTRNKVRIHGKRRSCPNRRDGIRSNKWLRSEYRQIVVLKIKRQPAISS
jgi:predicted metal-binding protein